MTGSLQQKNGKYYTVINTYENGKRKIKWESTGLPVKGNKTRATEILNQRKREYAQKELEAQQLAVDPGNIPFVEAIEEWLRQAKRRVDAVTYQGYENLVRIHIKPYFETLDITLRKVDKKILQTYFDEKAERGRVDGKGGLSARSLRLHKNVLYQTLNRAVGDGLIPMNPCEYVQLPRIERFEAHFYTASQVNALLSAVKDEPLFPVIKVTVVYGLRRSEALGLKWDCVDFENNTLTIIRTVVKVTHTVEKDKTKNQTSRRSFPLRPEIRELLLSIKAQQEQDRKQLGKVYVNNNGVFRWSDGRAFSPDYVTQKFHALLKKHDLPLIRFHDLRHSCASNLLSMGFTLKDVQEWLGHADIKVTANIYGHLDVQRKKKIAAAISGNFSEENAG